MQVRTQTGAPSYLTLLCLLALMLISPLSQANVKAGKVTALRGNAWAQLGNEDKRELDENSVVYEADVITTSRRSAVKVHLNDETQIQIGPKARFKIDKFSYDDKEDDGVTMSILKGAFRFVSGLIAKKKPRSMSVSTSVATIGIRGTDVAGEVSDTSATIILMEPQDGQYKTAIDVSNEFGSVTIDEPGYGTEIPDANSPPSPPRRMRLQTITNIMNSMQSLQRLNAPRPRMPH